MNTTSNQPNGARAKIIRALISEGMLTGQELSIKTGMTPKQVRDNANAAKQDGLITIELDDVTRSAAYKITPKGRLYYDAIKTKAPDTPAVTTEAPTAAEPVQIEAEEPESGATESDVEEEQTPVEAVPQPGPDKIVSDEPIFYAFEHPEKGLTMAYGNSQTEVVEEAHRLCLKHGKQIRIYGLKTFGYVVPTTHFIPST